MPIAPEKACGQARQDNERRQLWIYFKMRLFTLPCCATSTYVFERAHAPRQTARLPPHANMLPIVLLFRALLARKNLIQDKEHSILIIISTMAIASVMTFIAQVYIADYIHNATHPYGYMRAIVELGQFLLECTGNIAIQLTSSLSATLAISVFSSARSLLWGFTGAFVALTLLWLLRKTVVAQQ